MTEIKPALTAEEWAAKRAESRDESYLHVRFGLSREYSDAEALEVVTPADLVLRAADRHALAALALHGHPLGFTWDDVGLLDSWFVPPDGIDPIPDEVKHLRDRIAALLPPRGDEP